MPSPEENNSFDLLRLVLAVLVVYSHAYNLGGFGDEHFWQIVRQQVPAGSLAVYGFFGISGFLVTRSFLLRANWKHFVAARLLRILPGLYLSLLLTAFLFAPVISYFNAASTGWHCADAIGFVVKNALVRIDQWSIGGVLSALPEPGALNRALWSLLPELCCYGLVLVLGLIGSLSLRRANLLFVLSAFVLLHVALVLFPQRENLGPTGIQLTGWGPCIGAFLMGVVMYSFRTELGLGGNQAIFWWFGVAALLKFGGWLLLGPIVLPLAIIHGAYAIRISLPADLSYGIYILHYPLLQLLSAAGVNKNGFTVYLMSGLILTAIFAAFSWHFVEKPALRLKR